MEEREAQELLKLNMFKLVIEMWKRWRSEKLVLEAFIMFDSQAVVAGAFLFYCFHLIIMLLVVFEQKDVCWNSGILCQDKIIGACC